MLLAVRPVMVHNTNRDACRPDFLNDGTRWCAFVSNEYPQENYR